MYRVLIMKLFILKRLKISLSVWKFLKVSMKVWCQLLIKKNTPSDSNHTGLSRNNRGESALSNNHPMKDEITGKRRKRYVYLSKSVSKNCMIHGLGNSSYECKVFDEFGTKYAVDQPTKNCRSNPIPKTCFIKIHRTILLLTMWWMSSTWLNPKS